MFSGSTEAAVLAIAAKTDDGQIESFTIPYAEDMPVPEGLRSHQDHFGMKALVSLAVTSTLGK